MFIFASILSVISLIFSYNLNDEIANTNYIVFSNDRIKVSEGTALISGTTVIIEKPGKYLVTGESEEGNIVIKSNSVNLYLQHLMLSSKKTAPIIITNNLKDIKIINVQNTILNDYEDPDKTDGECAVIKIKKNSIVHFQNYETFQLYGECKNIIRGVSNVSLIFEKSDEGEYIIYTNKTAISTDGYLQFNGGMFTIFSDYGDAIKCSPDDWDTTSLGKILIKDGTFKIRCYGDAITAKYNITILNGQFDIKTQDGFDSEKYDENESSKGFKVTNDSVSSELKIYSGKFYLNTADDAFRSNRDLTILEGDYTIYSRDDGICAKYLLTLGKKYAPNDNLKINILYSFEALEGMKMVIYSGKIIATSDDDGINASGVVKKTETPRNRSRGWNNGNGQWPNFDWGNGQFPNFNNSGRNGQWPNGGNGQWPNGGNGQWPNGRNGTWPNGRNGTWPNGGNGQWPNGGNGQWPGRDFDWRNYSDSSWRNRSNENGEKRRGGTPGNSSYTISIFGGEIYVYSESDGIDTNGNVFIHGGSLSIFSKGFGSDAPIDHNGNFTLFNAELLGVGSEGFESVHEYINKGNLMYGVYIGPISENKILQIRNEKNEVVKEGYINKDIDYIFYCSQEINENYKFILIDEFENTITSLNVTFAYPESGEDDQDERYDPDEEKNYENRKNEGENNNGENKKEEDNNNNLDNANKENYSLSLQFSLLYIAIYLLF